MKTSLILNAFGIAILGAVLIFSAPVFGDENADALNKALDLVHQAWNPGGDPPSIDQRTNLLTQALKLIQQVPRSGPRFQGARRKTVEDILDALSELKAGDPNNKATDLIRDANSDLRTAISNWDAS